MYSARREGRELGQLREAACLMYEARRGEERCTSVWGTGATQGALTSPTPRCVPPPVQTAPWQPYWAKPPPEDGLPLPPPLAAPFRCHLTTPSPTCVRLVWPPAEQAAFFCQGPVTTNFRVRCDTV